MPKKKKKKKGKKEEVPMLLVQSKVKEYIKDQEYRTSSAFIEAFNKQVHLLLKKAIKRCDGNGRATVKDVDAI